MVRAYRPSVCSHVPAAYELDSGLVDEMRHATNGLTRDESAQPVRPDVFPQGFVHILRGGKLQHGKIKNLHFGIPSPTR